MKTRLFLSLSVGGMLFLAAEASAQRGRADILPPQRREAAVANGQKYAQRQALPELPDTTPNPFNPANFDQPDPESLPPVAPKTGPAAAGGAGAGAAAAPRPAGDREILETLAMRLNPSGTFVLGERSMIIIDRNRFEVGTKFIVTYDERDYELELVAIDRTTFTLRYRGEEITRSIKPVK